LLFSGTFGYTHTLTYVISDSKNPPPPQKKISYKNIHSFHNKYLLSMLAITDNSIIIAFKSIPQYTGRNKHSKSWNCHYLIILTQHLVVFCCVLLHTNYINNLLRIMKIIIINLSFFGKYEAKVFLPSS